MLKINPNIPKKYDHFIKRIRSSMMIDKFINNSSSTTVPSRRFYNGQKVYNPISPDSATILSSVLIDDDGNNHAYLLTNGRIEHWTTLIPIKNNEFVDEEDCYTMRVVELLENYYTSNIEMPVVSDCEISSNHITELFNFGQINEKLDVDYTKTWLLTINKVNDTKHIPSIIAFYEDRLTIFGKKWSELSDNFMYKFYEAKIFIEIKK